MGLRDGGTDHDRGSPIRAWILPAAIVAIAILIALTGDGGREFLRYDRAAIAGGELWRLLSGHFVHLGWPHLALNVAGLVLVWYLVYGSLRDSDWLLVMAAVIAGIDAGFWALEPQLRWYVGLSGVLHGMLAAGLVTGLGRQRPELWILAVLVLGKLAWEQRFGPLPGSESATGGAVVTAAHLYGAIAGAAAGALLLIRVRRRAPI
jgi:rhomboid family GlyGly-CTERM serine protease